jgi:hypothetical protein
MLRFALSREEALMSRAVLLSALLLALAVGVAPATAETTQQFKAELHDNLACPPGFDFCGKGLVHGFGTATTTLSFTGAVPGPGDCLTATAERTITLDSDGSVLLIAIAGTICDQKLEATYTIVSGTGVFAGAAGGGTLRGTATGVPLPSDTVHLRGVITMP